jgi:hypothetical protein
MGAIDEEGNCRRPFLGRPIRDDEGRAQLAPTRTSAEWKDALVLACAFADMTADARAAAARAWAENGAMEHASVAAFARLSLELMALGAPACLVDGAHAAAREEIRHATRAYAIASALAGTEIGPGPLALAPSARPVDLVTLARETFRDGCIGETTAAIEAAELRERADHTEIRDALDVVARDEAGHAELAFRIIAWAVSRGGAPVARAIAAELAIAPATPALAEVVAPCIRYLLPPGHMHVRAAS